MGAAGKAGGGGVGSHWAITAALIVADVIGGGVLALPGTLASMGWIAGIISLLLLGYVSLYTGQLIGRLHSLYPFVKSYGDLGAEFLGKSGRAAVSALAYLQMFGLCVVFLVGMTIFADQAATSMQLPTPCFVTLAAVLCAGVLLLAQSRDLKTVGHLACWVAGPTLYLALALFFYQVFGVPAQARGGETSLWPPFETSKTTVAFMSVVLTYAGHVVYFELITGMAEPKDFGKALFSSQAVIVVTYVAVAVPVYMALGSGVASPFQVSLTPTIAVGVADISMVLHVLISFLLNHHIISKALFDLTASSLARLRGGAFVDTPFGSTALGYVGWALATAAVTVCAWLVANLVPFFSDVMALLSSTAAVNLTYGFPAAAALLQHRRESKQEVAKTATELESGQAANSPSTEAPAARIFMYPRVEVPFCWSIVVLSAVMMLYGSVNAVRDTVDNWASNSRLPFAC